MDFSNSSFLQELNTVRKRINPREDSSDSSVNNINNANSISNFSSTNSLLQSSSDINNNYINLESLSKNKSSSKINIEYKNNEKVATTHETPLDFVYNPESRLISSLEKINKTLDIHCRIQLKKNNNCFYTSCTVMLSCISIVGLLIVNDYILLNYFI